MGLVELRDHVRSTLSVRGWGAAVELARGGAVQGLTEDGDEVVLRVKMRGHAEPFEVFLWPNDPDAGCNCGVDGACVHVAAAVIALTQSRAAGDALPAPKEAYRVSLRYDFATQGNELLLERTVVWPDGRCEPLQTSLAEANLLASRGDVQAESLLVLHPGGPLTAQRLRRLLQFLEGNASATLDGAPIQLSSEPVSFRVRVADDGEDFRVSLVRPGGLDQLYRGAALRDGVLYPTSHGTLETEQRRTLMLGISFAMRDVGRLVTSTLPRLRERIPVDVVTDRLPRPEALVPSVRLQIGAVAEGLEVDSLVAYGDPPVATLRGSSLEILSDVVPARDIAGERKVRREFRDRMGLEVGHKMLLRPERAAEFLHQRMPLHQGPIDGDVDVKRFRVVDTLVEPHLAVEETEDAQWRLDVTFTGGEYEAEAMNVLRAWRAGRSLVPRLDGGYAPLPADWLDRHGALLTELFDARDAQDKVNRNATAALVELLEDTAAEVPQNLQKLRAFLEGDEGLPEVTLPEGFVAELRPYQWVGYRWLRFLKDMDLSGILADDMGLGKTVQALAVLAHAGGRNLVVAPTSVLRNWEREVHRFAPRLRVSVYHGPGRQLNDEDDITLTSYALLRIDREQFTSEQWNYVVLDEAQYIKNPDSQTAKSAFALQANHRLTLTGTPIENRLEELWSQFRFLMPGLLGSRKTFREQFVYPVETGDPVAKRALRRRIRPYVLRRLKREVASDLPALTQMVIPCPMTPKQQEVYDVVRNMARNDVMKAFDLKKRGAAIQVLEALLRMRQACCDPSLLPGKLGAEADSGKLNRLEELLVDIVCEGHKALVFSQWTGLLDRVEPRLRALDIDWVRLDGSTRDRQRVIDAFQNAKGPPIFLLSLKAGGTGLNLTEADYVVHLDPWWNPAVEQQATDRAHRIGQTRPVVSCRLISQGTVEERILELQDAKRNLAEATLGTDSGFLGSLTATELRSLFESE